MSHAEETIAAAARLDHPWDALSLDWPLDKDSVVVEVGGYKGRWALQIAERYAPRLYVFEPQPWAFQACCEVLGDNANVYNFALGTDDGTFPMSEWETDGCSFAKGMENGQGVMHEIGKAFGRLGIREQIDLMLINIEGYEYTLIPHMLSRGILPKRLMVQFHMFADEDGQKMAAIYAQLGSLYYRIAWSYGTVLTAWGRL